MSTSYLFNATANLMLAKYITQVPCWLACHTSNPGTLCDLSTEVSGMGYGRQPITFGQPAGRAVVSTNDQAFSAMPQCTVTWLSVQGDQFVLAPVFAVQIADPGVVVAQGKQLLVAAGDVAHQFL